MRIQRERLSCRQGTIQRTSGKNHEFKNDIGNCYQWKNLKLMYHCCFETCKQWAFQTWLLQFLVINVPVSIGIFLFNCIGFILKMNPTIQKLHLNLNKDQLFIRDNDHEVYHHFFLSTMLFLFSCWKPKQHEKLTVLGSNINSFPICVEFI